VLDWTLYLWQNIWCCTCVTSGNDVHCNQVLNPARATSSFYTFFLNNLQLMWHFCAFSCCDQWAFVAYTLFCRISSNVVAFFRNIPSKKIEIFYHLSHFTLSFDHLLHLPHISGYWTLATMSRTSKNDANRLFTAIIRLTWGYASNGGEAADGVGFSDFPLASHTSTYPSKSNVYRTQLTWTYQHETSSGLGSFKHQFRWAKHQHKTKHIPECNLDEHLSVLCCQTLECFMARLSILKITKRSRLINRN
jgi:hypothetical protein